MTLAIDIMGLTITKDVANACQRRLILAFPFVVRSTLENQTI